MIVPMTPVKGFTPDRWVIIKMENEGKSLMKILSGNLAGYLDNESWRLSSEIISIEETLSGMIAKTGSGSIYRLLNDYHGMTLETICIWDGMKKLAEGHPKFKLEILPMILEVEDRYE